MSDDAASAPGPPSPAPRGTGIVAFDPARLWSLDPAIAFLNHGSFGACPLPVLETQARLRARMEREPVRFLAREIEGFLDEARDELALFLGADPDDLAFVPNATAGVNTVLRSLRFERGDELLTTDHAYNACRNALEFIAAAAGARVVVVSIPFPIDGPERAAAAVLGGLTRRTRLVLLDHVTSPTGLVLPVRDIARALDGTAIDLLVDGAHAPGMVPLDLEELGATYYTGNAHKWLCAPKGAAFLWVRKDRQADIRPLSISHGWNDRRTSRSRFRLLFDWTGTDDPTPYLCVPEALRLLAAQFHGGIVEVMERNRALALSARATLCGTLGIPPPAPPEMIGSLAAVPLPAGKAERPAGAREVGPLQAGDSLQRQLLAAYGIEVPIIPWPAAPSRLVRISAQLYNRPEQYERLASALAELLP